MPRKKSESNSQHKRTNNNAKRTARIRQTDIEKILAHLPDDVEKEFKTFARYHHRQADLAQWLFEAQADYYKHFPENWQIIRPTVSQVQFWKASYYPVGDKAKVLNELTSAYIGLDYDQVIESSLAQSVTLCMELTSRLDREGVDDIAPEQVLQQVAALQRTVSALYKDLQKSRSTATMRDSEMAGAQRLADIILHQFKDQAGEEAIKQAVIGALEQIEHEVYGATP